MIKKANKDENDRAAKKNAYAAGSVESDIDSMTKDGPDDSQASIHSFHKDTIIRLFQLKFTLGSNNFFNIFHCFYMLSKVPKNAQNNPFALYMDE